METFWQRFPSNCGIGFGHAQDYTISVLLPDPFYLAYASKSNVVDNKY